MTELVSIKKLISKNQLAKAMDNILNIVEGGDNYNEAVLLALQLNYFQIIVIRGQFSSEEQLKIMVGLANQILQFLDLLDKKRGAV